MIWISTLCLLAVAAWLLLNALNERKWVEAHSHDETVASDPGLFPSLTALTTSGTLDSDGKLSIDQENTKFARAVTSVKEKTAKYGDKFIEAKIAAGQAVDGEVQPAPVSEEDSSFGRAVAKMGGITGRLDNKLDKTIKAASERTSKFGVTDDPDEPLMSRVSRKVSSSTENLGDVVVARAKNASQSVREKTAASRESGMLGKVAGSVATGVSKLEGSAPKDLFSRIASKVGAKVNDIDDKVSAKVGDKVNEIDDKVTSSVGGKVNKLDDKLQATMGEKINANDDKLVKPVKESVD